MLESKNKIILFVLFWMVFIVATIYGWQTFKSSNILVGKGEKQTFIIPTGADYQQVVDTLLARDLVGDLTSFSFVAKVLGYQDAVKAGRYTFDVDMNNLNAVRRLRAGNQTPVNVSFHNVRLPQDLADRITQNIEITPAQFLQAFNDPKLQDAYGFDAQTFLCMFIPNTYEVWYNVSAENLIKRLSKEYDKFWTEARLQKAKEMKLDKKEVCTLASIVNAETIKASETSRIAGLYYNRIKKGMRLQADPTLVFAVGDFNINRVLNIHKEVESPYNTYKYVGLPPGPINLPSGSTIDKVLNYEDHDYLFMCAKEDFSGFHNFAVTNKQHAANARRFQMAMNKRKIYK